MVEPPIWKICSSKWVHLPQIGVNIKNIWNHHLGNYLFPWLLKYLINGGCATWSEGVGFDNSPNVNEQTRRTHGEHVHTQRKQKRHQTINTNSHSKDSIEMTRWHVLSPPPHQKLSALGASLKQHEVGPTVIHAQKLHIGPWIGIHLQRWRNMKWYFVTVGSNGSRKKSTLLENFHSRLCWFWLKIMILDPFSVPNWHPSFDA